MIDRRTASRIDLMDLPAEYQAGVLSRWEKCTVLQVSSGGIKMTMTRDIKKGTHIKVRFRLPHGGAPILLTVKVVRLVRSAINPGFEMGGSFIATQKRNTRDDLTQYITERLCKSIVWLGAGISVRPVESHEEVIAVFRLIYKEYLKRSFCMPNARKLFFCSQSLLPTTEMFIVKKNDKFMGSISLMGDSPAGLPADHLYPEEVSALRGEGRRVVEAGLLTLNLEAFSKKTFSMGDLEKMRCLFHLFKMTFDYARHTMKATDLIIHVNPKHRLLYEFLAFEEIGPVRYYANIQNKPAILMRMDVAKAIREHSTPQSRGSHFVMNCLPAELLQKRFVWTADQIRPLVKDDWMWKFIGPAAQAHLLSCYPELR